jgi:hypothetical protein
MATYQQPVILSVEAGSAVTKFRFVVRAADGQYDHVGTAQKEADGVSTEAASAAGDALGIAIFNDAIMKVEAGAAVAANATVASDNVGRAITHVTTATNWRLGKALDAASAAGEVIRVQLHKELDEA